MQNVFSTDGQLLGGKFKLLADPKHVFGFQNVAPVVKKSVLAAEGPGVRRNAQQGQRAADDQGDPADERGRQHRQAVRHERRHSSSSKPTDWASACGPRQPSCWRISCEACGEMRARVGQARIVGSPLGVLVAIVLVLVLAQLLLPGDRGERVSLARRQVRTVREREREAHGRR